MSDEFQLSAGCWSLLDAKKNLILASYSSPVVSDELASFLRLDFLAGFVCLLKKLFLCFFRDKCSECDPLFFF